MPTKVTQQIEAEDAIEPSIGNRYIVLMNTNFIIIPMDLVAKHLEQTKGTERKVHQTFRHPRQCRSSSLINRSRPIIEQQNHHRIDDDPKEKYTLHIVSPYHAAFRAARP